MSLKHAVLGLLAQGPLTGYDLKQRLDVTGVWPADQSQIYRTLAALVDDGLVTRTTVVQTDRPSQHPHQVTSAGLAELDRWLATEPEPLPGGRDPLVARLWSGGRRPAAETRRTLAIRRDELAALEAELTRSPWPRGHDLTAALRYAALARRLAHVRTELAWVDATDELVARFDTSAGDTNGKGGPDD